MEADPILTPEEAAATIRTVKVQTLTKWRYRKIGPIYVKFENGRVGYRQSDLTAYIDASRVVPGEKEKNAQGKRTRKSHRYLGS